MAASGQGDVMAECWRSCIPVQLRLAASEVTAVEQPSVHYFLVPRHSYLLSLLPKALPLLQHVLPPGEDTPWVEHKSLPLKWNVPAGVLYDLLAGEEELPWSLTLHLRGYPSSVLPAYGGEAALRGALLNSLKEAAFICRGSSLRVMEMSPGSQEDLYRSVYQQDLQLYRSVLHSVQLAPVARAGRQPAIPLRVFLRSGGRGYLSSYEGIAYTSRPAEAQRPGGAPVTLSEALLPLVSDFAAASAAAAAGGAPGTPASAASLLPASPAGAGTATDSNVAGAAAEASADAEAAYPAAVEASPATVVDAAYPAAAASAEGSEAVEPEKEGAEGGSEAEGRLTAAVVAEGPGEAAAVPSGTQPPPQFTVLIGGVSPPLETPLAWLHANMHAADYFLYAVVQVQG